MRIGAFDDHYHFLDAGTGVPSYPDLVTGDLAKGSATTDADGYPLYYAGSRDNQLRVVAMDRPQPTVLWQVDAHTSVPEPLWNDDWDGAPLQIGDYLLEGGENSWFYVIRLHRGYGPDGLVRVDPQIVAIERGWDDQLLRDLHDPPPAPDVSIEDSVAYRDGIVYFANSGGLVQGWDISDLLNGGTAPPKRVFRFWTGDDTDASVVIDADGFLYVASEYQRFNERSKELGQLMKLDPRRPDDPVVWSIPATEIGFEGAGGSWSTPALYGDYVYFTTAAGRVLEVERSTGRIVWEEQINAPTIASPVVVDGTLAAGRLLGPPLRLGRVRSDGAAAAGVGSEPRRLHRVDAGRVARLDLRRHARGVHLRHRGRGYARAHRFGRVAVGHSLAEPGAVGRRPAVKLSSSAAAPPRCAASACARRPARRPPPAPRPRRPGTRRPARSCSGCLLPQDP